jgi:tRNA threonylcarbamoyladenosine biosynthesis protein TsaE
MKCKKSIGNGMDTTENQTFVFHSKREQETFDFGVKLGRALKKPIILGLIGELGSGKTVFVRGLSAGLDAPPNVAVTSPTFQLVNIYPGGRLTLFHVDAYRLSGAHAFEDLDVLNQAENCVLAIEWADRIRETLPGGVIWLEFSHEGTTSREIRYDASLMNKLNLTEG